MIELPYGSAEQGLAPEPPPITIGRYLLHRQIARGGMATIHIARLIGDVGFSRIVAAKRLLPEFAEDPEFVAMFLEEARIASKVHHRNVVPVLDVVTTGAEAILVQEYVHGAPLHWLLRTAQQGKTHIPPDIAVSIACQVLSGLHAAHETLDEMGMPLNIVHRDVSPQNVMVATDGTARLLDFGVAKAAMGAHVTRDGLFKGKLAYSPPEQLRGQATRQSDLYSLAVLLWELLVGHRMHQTAQAEAELVATIMRGELPTITEALASERGLIGAAHWHALQAIEPIIKTGLAVKVTDRWTTAAAMEQALIDVIQPASLSEVAAWLKSLGKPFLDKHDRVLAAEEASWRRLGTTMQRRPAPATGEVRRATQVVSPADPGVPLTQPQRPPPRQGRGANTLIGVLCGLVTVLAVGIVFAGRGPAARSATVTAPVLAPPALVPADHPGAGVPGVRPVELPARAMPAAAASTDDIARPDKPAPPPDAIELRDAPLPAPSVMHNPGAPARKLHPQPLRQPTAPQRKPQSAGARPATDAGSSSPATPPSAADPGADCNPPYYYEDQKKIFKPSCI
jgi:eukaryotic-like serine/threonine-protein kinase